MKRDREKERRETKECEEGQRERKGGKKSRKFCADTHR